MGPRLHPFGPGPASPGSRASRQGPATCLAGPWGDPPPAKAWADAGADPWEGDFCWAPASEKTACFRKSTWEIWDGLLDYYGPTEKWSKLTIPVLRTKHRDPMLEGGLPVESIGEKKKEKKRKTEIHQHLN